MLLVWTVVVYAVAMLGFAAEFAFGRRTDSAQRVRRIGATAVALTVVGWGLHIGSVTTRGLAAHRVPWGNMYEFSCMVALGAVTVFLVLVARHRARFLGAFVMAPVVLYLGLAGTVLYAAPGPLVPALNSYWIKIHVVAAITASGAFMISGVLTLLYLVASWLERRTSAVSLGPGTAAAVEIRTPATGLRADARQTLSGLAQWLPSSERLDRLTYRVVAFAFPIWT